MFDLRWSTWLGYKRPSTNKRFPLDIILEGHHFHLGTRHPKFDAPERLLVLLQDNKSLGCRPTVSFASTGRWSTRPNQWLKPGQLLCALLKQRFSRHWVFTLVLYFRQPRLQLVGGTISDGPAEGHCFNLYLPTPLLDERDLIAYSTPLTQSNHCGYSSIFTWSWWLPGTFDGGYLA